MKQTEILKEVNQDKLRYWLLLTGPPLLRDTSFYEEMGFPAWFVRQYLRKHSYVLQLDGRIQRKVRGINEVDFLYGLAEAIGINTSEMNRRNYRYRQATDIARECLRVLDEMDGDDDDNEPEQIVVSEEVMRSDKSNVRSGAKRGHKYVTVKG